MTTTCVVYFSDCSQMEQIQFLHPEYSIYLQYVLKINAVLDRFFLHPFSFRFLRCEVAPQFQLGDLGRHKLPGSGAATNAFLTY